jgi:threonine aldolase
VLGCKVMTLEGPGGKVAPEALEAALSVLGSQHAAQPSCLSITQPTERGELYSIDELRILAAIAHSRGLWFHMDGARIANACASLGIGLAEATCDAGVDILSFGGMKDGLAFGECVIVFRPELAGLAPYLRKAFLQLDSKMRFVSAQYLAWIESGAWLRNAQNANAVAAHLARNLSSIPGVRIVNDVKTNAVFARLPEGVAERLREAMFFYDMEPGLSRFVASFDSSAEDADNLATELRRLCAR